MHEHHLDLNHSAFVFDPYPTLAELRAHLPVFYDPVWKKMFFTRYEDIAALLRDRRLGRSILHVLSRDELGWPPPDPLTRDFDRFQSDHMLDNEPPKHTRLKTLMLKAFTTGRVEGLRGTIQRIVDGLIDRVETRGEMDLLKDFAEPLPVAVIAELLGVPEADRTLLRPWSAKIVRLLELHRRIRHPRAQGDAGRVLDVQLAQFAGHHVDDPLTHVREVVGGALEVARDDEQFQSARHDPGILDHEIQEVMEDAIPQLVDDIILLRRLPGPLDVLTPEGVKGLPNHLLQDGIHLRDIDQRLHRRLFPETLHGARDALRMIGHALEIDGDGEHRRDHPEVARHRLLGGQQSHAPRLQVHVQGVDGVVLGDDALRGDDVAAAQGFDGAMDRLTGLLSHAHDVVLQLLQFPLVRFARHYPNRPVM